MSDKIKPTSVGGQAVIEGVMMRGPKVTAMAVRNPEGEIVLEQWENETKNKSKFFKLPIIRGVFNFIVSMKFGYKCLMISAEKSGLEDLEESEENSSKLDKWLNEHINKKVLGVLTGVASILGMLLAFLLFFYLPTIAVNFLNKLSNDALLNYRALFEGVIRMAIFALPVALSDNLTVI